MQLKRAQAQMGDIRNLLARTKTFFSSFVTSHDDFYESMKDVLINLEASFVSACNEANAMTGVKVSSPDVGVVDIRITDTSEARIVSDMNACVYAAIEPCEKIYLGENYQGIVFGSVQVPYTQAFMERMWDVSNDLKLLNIMLTRAAAGNFEVVE